MCAAGSAWAETRVVVQAGKQYAINSAAPAAGNRAVAYQWFRNGKAISYCTDSACVIPASDAVGSDVEFTRMATVNGDCIGTASGYTDAVVVTFCNLLVDGLCWADVNVWNPGEFAENLNDYSRLFSNPSLLCPEGWRLPSTEEWQKLYDITLPNGSHWADYGAKGNSLAGRFYGYNASSCSFTGSMAGCIFLPAEGMRTSDNGSRADEGISGYYWSSTSGSVYAYYFKFDSSSSNSSAANISVSGYNLSARCVQ